MSPRLNRTVGVLLVVISALMTIVVYSAYTDRLSTSSLDLLSGIVMWSSLCLPELVAGLHLLWRKESVETATEEEDMTRILIAPDVTETPDETFLICPHCEYVFQDSEGVSGSEVCPNCEQLVVPMI